MKKLLLLYCCLAHQFLLAQHTASGIILDKGDNMPLAGVSVRVKGAGHIGATSGLEGSYSLSVPENTTDLVFSYTGYQSRELPIEECENATIYLSVSATLLNEVLVVGYGTQVRSNLTGNVSRIKKEDIEGTPVNSVESTLQGRAAGVFISNNSGKLGQNIDVRIRGTASINASVEPLYVVDGVVINSGDQLSFTRSTLNPLADINFNDIESIDILKDASAAAIYGSRASNGVIIITTKKGVANTTRIDFDMNMGWSSPTRKRTWLNAAQYLEIWDEAFANVANPDNGRLFGQTAEEWKDRWLSGWRDGYDTNWEELMYNPDAGQQQVQLNIAGGNEKTKYYISGGYSDQTAIVILNAFERVSGRINLSHQASEKLDFGMNMSLARTKQDVVETDINFAAPSGIISQSPVQPLYDPANPNELFDNTFYFHARHYIDNTDLTATNFRTLGNVFMNWRPIKNLNLHTDFGLDLLNTKGEYFFNSKVARNTGAPNGLKRSNAGQALNYSVNHYANYQISDQQHNFDITAGMSYQELNESSLGVAGTNFPNDDFQNLSSAGEIFRGFEDETAFSVLSWFGRLHYNFDQKYLFSLSSRIDGDSRFGEDNRYGFFPAASLGWVISREPFFINEVFSYLKIRSSWGLTGNTPLEHFPALGLFEGTRYAGGSGIIQTQIPNPDLKWEKTTQIDVGIDFGLLEDRISGQLDYYLKSTNDLLLQVNIPSTTGFPTQLQNVGAMQNEGIELLLSSYNLTGAFKWKTTLNFSKNKNIVTDLQQQVIEAGIGQNSISRVMEGQPTGVFFAPEYAGVDPDNGDGLFYLNNELENGQLDRNTTNNYNEAQRVVIGDPNPDFIYGISNTFSWKGMELGILFQGVSGNDIYNAAGRFQMDGFGWFDNQDIRMLNRWQKPGDQTDIPQVRFLQASFHSSRFIEDGAYLRLKNVNLSYQLPANWVDKIGFRQLKIYLTGQNLLTVTQYNGWDPEVNTDVSDLTPNGNIIAGQDFFTPPQAKTIVFGVKAGF